MVVFSVHFQNPLVAFIAHTFGRFNSKKYFKRRAIVTDPANKTPLIVKYYYLFWIKRQDLKYHCTFGAGLHIGNKYTSAPFLPHGPYGIIVGSDVELGEGVILYPMSTIPAGGTKIGSHSELGVKATVLQGVRIGSYCHVGANAVAIHDLPDYATVVMNTPRVILHNESRN